MTTAFYSLIIGAADMGTGCDTILAQMAAECLDCDWTDMSVYGAWTLTISPYDSGSYASSTTYVTGMAVVKTCEELQEKILRQGAAHAGLFLRRKPSLTASGCCDGRRSGRSASRRSAMPVLERTQRAACQASVVPLLARIAAALYGGMPRRSSWTRRPARFTVVDYAAAGGLRHGHQPGSGPGADRGRHCPGHRHGAL